VACAAKADIFCRECVVSNLLAQKKEIKRLEKEVETRRKEDEEREDVKTKEEERRALEEFERVSMGLGAAKKTYGGAKHEDDDTTAAAARGTKRKFALDESELLQNALAERAKARKSLDAEAASKASLPSFWVPSLTPNSAPAPLKAPKLQPVCPASADDAPHALSLKTLVSVNFSTESKGKGGVEEGSRQAQRICPSCKKGLSNGLKAMLAIPCGHVMCKPCVERFMPPQGTPDPHADGKGEVRRRCYVCEADLSERPKKKKEKKAEGRDGEDKEEKERLRPGLVEISAEGTGFAGGGKNMARKEGTAFQC
jgi:nitric oxide synthase-interacting protein